MVFSSIEFLIFFTIVFITILIAESKTVSKKIPELYVRKFKHIFLLIASYIFYGWWDWRFCFMVWASGTSIICIPGQCWQ